MKAEDLKKNEWYEIDNGLKAPGDPRVVRAKLIESPRQGRGYKEIVLMDVKGSDVGFFDEIGSVYAFLFSHYLQILLPKIFEYIYL